jgi:hypothetical protein
MKLIAVLSHDNYYVNFITLLLNWYNNRLLTQIRHFFIIPIEINEFVGLELCFADCLNQFCRDLITTWIFIIFNFAIAISPSR